MWVGGSVWVTLCGGHIDDRADGESRVGVPCVVAVIRCAWAGGHISSCGGYCGDVRIRCRGAGRLCSVVGGAVWWLGGSGFSAVLSGNCWAVPKQLQLSLMIWHWNVGAAGVWIVQCLCMVWRSCFLNPVTSVWVTFRTVALSVVMRRSMGDCEIRRCVRIQDWVTPRYANTKRPQS